MAFTGAHIQWLDHDFGELLKAVEICERAVTVESDAVVSRHKMTSQSRLGPFSRFAGYAQFQTDLWTANMLLPTILRRSLFISTFALVERRLNDWCNGIANLLKPATDFPAFCQASRDKGIARARAYLKGAVGLAFPDQSPERNQLCQHSLIRNLLVHTGGSVTRESDMARVKHVPKIEVTDAREINLLPGFCEGTVETARRFFALMFAEYGRHLPGQDAP